MPSEASATIWRWREDERPAVAEVDSGALRRRALVQVTAACVIAGGAAWLGHRSLAIVAGSVASMVLLVVVVSPRRGLAVIERLVERLARAVGWVLNWVLLSLVFFAFFVPFGAICRRGRRDTMRRTFEPDASTYWLERAPVTPPPGARKKQF